MKWKDKLTRPEQKHLREMGIYSLKAMRLNRETQVKMKEYGDPEVKIEPCWECRRIAVKLGLEQW
jgi:hypothetical protein